MKKIFYIFTFISLTMSNLYATNWLKGVYVNQDKNSLIKEVLLCPAGKAYVVLAKRTYKIIEKNNEKFVVLDSNGVFTFKISDDNKELFPSDSFTKEWGSKSKLKLNPSRKDKCNW